MLYTSTPMNSQFLNKDAPLFVNILKVNQLFEEFFASPLRKMQISKMVWENILENLQLNIIGGTTDKLNYSELFDENYVKYFVLDAVPWLKIYVDEYSTEEYINYYSDDKKVIFGWRE